MTEQLSSHLCLSVSSFPAVHLLLGNLCAVNHSAWKKALRSDVSLALPQASAASSNSNELILWEHTGNLRNAELFLLQSAPPGLCELLLVCINPREQMKCCSHRGLTITDC